MTQLAGFVCFAPARVFSRLLGVVVLSAGATVAAACGGQPAAGAEGGGAGPGGGPGMPVEVVELAPKPVEESAEFVGILRSRRSSTIKPQAEGFLTGIRVKSGDRLEVGAPMFEIDDTAQKAAVASLESVRVARDADAAFAKQQSQRIKALLDVGATSQQEYEQAITAERSAEAQLKAADEQIRQQKAEWAYYRVAAPITGIVGDVPVRVGDRVTKDTTLTTIDSNTGLEVYINVPVQQAAKLRMGLPVRLLSENGETLATERINFVSASVD